MTFKDYDNTYAFAIRPDHTLLRSGSEEADHVNVVFVDDDSQVSRDWFVLDVSSEGPHLAPADCEGLQGGLGI